MNTAAGDGPEKSWTIVVISVRMAGQSGLVSAGFDDSDDGFGAFVFGRVGEDGAGAGADVGVFLMTNSTS
jgi:hypothetical protein